MTWETVSLGDLVRPVSGRAGSEELPVYSVTKHAGFVPSREYFKKQVFSSDLTTYKVVDAGQFAYATIHLDEGSIGIAPERCVISPMYTVFSVDPLRVHAPYLLRYLKSPTGLAEYPRLGRGTAERRKSIGLDALGRIRLVIPPLAEQRRIAAILDEADRTATNARHSPRQLEKLAEAIFSGSLRDSLEQRSLRELGVTLRSGLSVGDGGREAHPTNRILKVSAVSRGIYDPSEIKPMPAEYAAPQSHRVAEGDLLMTRASGSLDLIARSAFARGVTPGLFLPDKIWRVELSNHSPLSHRFVDALTRSAAFRGYVHNAASGASGVRNISQAKVLDFMTRVPSRHTLLDLEDSLEQLEVEQARSENRVFLCDDLFSSLQYRAFRGEL